MTRSEAIRYLIKEGLDQSDKIPGIHVSHGGFLGFFGLIFATTQYVEGSGLIGPIGVALIVAGIIHDLAHRLDLINHFRGEKA